MATITIAPEPVRPYVCVNGYIVYSGDDLATALQVEAELEAMTTRQLIGHITDLWRKHPVTFSDAPMIVQSLRDELTAETQSLTESNA